METTTTGTVANMDIVLGNANVDPATNDEGNFDVLQSAILALKSKIDGPFLRSGKRMDLPVNLFNSENRIVKLSKTKESFHLYRYVLNKKQLPITNKNQMEWNRLVNELRLKVKRSSERNVIASMELKIVNQHRADEPIPLPPLTTVKDIDEYLFENWGNKMRVLYMKITHDMYSNNHNQWMRDGLRDMLKKWCITLYQQVIDEKGQDKGIIYTDSFGSWLSQMKLGRKTSQKRRERFLKKHIKETMYLQPRHGVGKEKLIPVNTTGFGSAKACYKLVQCNDDEEEMKGHSTLHSLVSKLIKDGYSKQDVIQEFDRIQINESIHEPYTTNNQSCNDRRKVEPTVANINITMMQTTEPPRNQYYFNNNNNATANATANEHGNANAVSGYKSTTNATASGYSGMADARANNKATANAKADGSGVAKATALTDGTANAAAKDDAKAKATATYGGTANADANDNGMASAHANNSRTKNDEDSKYNGSDTTITDSEIEETGNVYDFDNLNLSDDDSVEESVEEEQFQQHHGAGHKNVDSMRDNYQKQNRIGPYKRKKKKKKPKSPPTKPTRSSPRTLAKLQQEQQQQQQHNDTPTIQRVPKKLDFKLKDLKPMSSSMTNKTKVI